MKKIALISTLLCTIVAVKAQYFQHLYGTANSDFLHSGVNTAVQGQGHFMAGASTDPTGSTNYLAAVFTDVDGNVPGAPYFENNYTLISNGGTVLNVSDAQVFEFSNGSGFGIVGTYIDPSGAVPGSGVYFVKLDGSGNPLFVQDFTPVPAAHVWEVGAVGGVCKSASGNELYVTGGVTTSTGLTHIFAMKLDLNAGTLIWSGIYEIQHYATLSREAGKAIVESPYAAEVVIAGSSQDQLPVSTLDGFILRLDANTGALLSGWTPVYGSRYDDDHFTSITVAKSTAGGSVGFVLGGNYDTGNNPDAWLMKTDPTCTATIWSSVFDYSQNQGTGNSCFSVIERFNGGYSYYMGGSADQGAFGSSDALVIRTDDSGNGLPNGEYTYGTSGWEQCRQLDQFNGTAADGLSIYANAAFSGNLGAGDFYLVKSYFDGNSGCNESFGTPVSAQGPGYLGSFPIQRLSSFTSGPLLIQTTGISDLALCYNKTIPGGSNARPALGDNNLEVIASPNPMPAETASATLKVGSQTSDAVQVSICDLLGRQYYSGEFILVKGENQLTLDLSKANMSPGLHIVKVSGASLSESMLLIVK